MRKWRKKDVRRKTEINETRLRIGEKSNLKNKKKEKMRNGTKGRETKNDS